MKHMACNGISSSPFFPPNFMLQMQTSPHDHQEDHPTHTTTQLTPFLTSNQCTNHEDFIGVAAMLGGKRSSMSFSGIEMGDEMNGEDDLSDDCSHAGEKKRRLNTEQVRVLEKNFELGNKLEPERKMQLARALGLQPRQIAIWFQNRRARWKTKQLEKDYEMLKLRFEAIKAENDGLQAQNKKLQDEVLALRGREASELINLNKATEGSSSNRSENSSEINLDISRTSAPNESPLHHHQHHHHHHTHESITFFPSIRPELHIPKAENSVAMEENFSNLLCGMEDQSAFWPWPDHQGFH